MTILNMPDQLEMTLIAIAMDWDTADDFIKKNEMFGSVESGEEKKQADRKKVSLYRTAEHYMLYLLYR